MTKQLHFLHADDDPDDRFFFDMILKGLVISTRLTAMEDGEKLMIHLSLNFDPLPDVLFLDLNMPRKNGLECLKEIKQNENLKQLPVVIYSTSLHNDLADELYNSGAHYYIRKSSLEELEKNLTEVLDLMTRNKFIQPSRDQFILGSMIKT
jgi:CheY-like chemotaxis protein